MTPTPTPTPLEVLSLAQLRREDPDLAMRLAEQAGRQHTMEMRDAVAANRDSAEGRDQRRSLARA